MEKSKVCKVKEGLPPKVSTLVRPYGYKVNRLWFISEIWGAFWSYFSSYSLIIFTFEHVKCLPLPTTPHPRHQRPRKLLLLYIFLRLRDQNMIMSSAICLITDDKHVYHAGTPFCSPHQCNFVCLWQH